MNKKLRTMTPQERENSFLISVKGKLLIDCWVHPHKTIDNEYIIGQGTMGAAIFTESNADGWIQSAISFYPPDTLTKIRLSEIDLTPQ